MVGRVTRNPLITRSFRPQSCGAWHCYSSSRRPAYGMFPTQTRPFRMGRRKPKTSLRFLRDLLRNRSASAILEPGL
jgi:hypothetical protein